MVTTWFWLQLWCRFDSWPRNFCIPWVWPKKKKKKAYCESPLSDSSKGKLDYWQLVGSFVFFLNMLYVCITSFLYLQVVGMFPCFSYYIALEQFPEKYVEHSFSTSKKKTSLRTKSNDTAHPLSIFFLYCHQSQKSPMLPPIHLYLQLTLLYFEYVQ